MVNRYIKTHGCIIASLFSIFLATGVCAAPSYPTYTQVERVIGATKEAHGEEGAYAESCTKSSRVYSQPTFGQVERLIAETLNGTNMLTEVSGARYLSMWNSATGLPLTNRTDVTYRTGDLYIVGNTDGTVVTNYYAHRITMHGPVDGFSYPASGYTNLVFTITNTTENAYTDFDSVYVAVSETEGGTERFGVTAESGHFNNGADEWDICATAADIPDYRVLSLKYDPPSCISHFPGGWATNATYLLDVVTPLNDQVHMSSVTASLLRPSGTKYISGVASTTVETNSVSVGDIYWYDGTDWSLIHKDVKVTSVNGRTGDVTVRTFEPFKDEWENVGTTVSKFLSDVAATDPSAGSCFLGEFNNMDPGPNAELRGGNYEVVLEVPVEGIYTLRATSTTTSPYYWWGYGSSGSFSGWRTVLNTQCPANNGKYTAQLTVVMGEEGILSETLEWKKLPDIPSSDGDYVLKLNKSGDTVTYSWSSVGK